MRERWHRFAGRARILAACAAVGAAGCDDDAPAPAEVGCEGCLALAGGVVFDGTRAGVGTVVLEGDRVREVVLGDARVVAGEVVDAATAGLPVGQCE